MNILFIGNSFTYYNDMPAILNGMAGTAGVDLHAEKLTYGGYYLRWYTTPENPHGNEAVPMLQTQPWDYVVLQEQSNCPATKPGFFAEGVDALMPHIRAAGARPVFYKTWAYCRDSDKLASSGMEYAEMLEKLTAAYDAEAVRHDALTVPAGENFFRLMEDHPAMNLYKEDAYHPNLMGSYLVAGMFYRLFTGRKPPEDWIPEHLDTGFARLLQEYM